MDEKTPLQIANEEIHDNANLIHGASIHLRLKNLESAAKIEIPEEISGYDPATTAAAEEQKP